MKRKNKDAYDYARYLKTAILVKQLNQLSWWQFAKKNELHTKLKDLNHG